MNLIHTVGRQAVAFLVKKTGSKIIPATQNGRRALQGMFLRRVRDGDPLHHRQVQAVQAGRLRRHRRLGWKGLDGSGSRHEDAQRSVPLRAEIGPALNRRRHNR